ncbi:MAG: hypothetical protein L0H74_00710 [Brachybacterium sp.]|nr:hypothetical protein [Brachybacterium sp.]
MARKSLSGLLEAPREVVEAPAAPTPKVATPSPTPADSAAATPPPARAPLASVEDLDDEATPSYLQMARKEARIRHDQADALSALTRRLNRERRGAGERITDNTLIRVAIDMLLAQEAGLKGATEGDLRTSVGL